MRIVSWKEVAVLGVVQGLTEFLPISSSAHLRIIPLLFGWADPGASFSAVLQLGTLAAVLIYFWRDLFTLTKAAIIALLAGRPLQSLHARQAWYIVWGNVPIIVCGLTFRDWIEGDARTISIIGTMLIVVAIALWWADKTNQQTKDLSEMRAWQAVAIGCFQTLALIPGASRSGTTLLGGLLLGFSRSDAARFSFLLGIPAILGSGLLQLPDTIQAFSTHPSGLGILAGGVFLSALSGLLTIVWFLRYLRQHSLTPFVLYRLLVGAFLLWQLS